jgi:hypothetical protein
MVNIAAAKVATRIPGLRRIPLVELVIVAEVMMLAKQHYERLTPKERRRMVILVRDTRGRPSNLTLHQRRELEELVAKAQPRLFAAVAAQKLSPLSFGRRR